MSEMLFNVIFKGKFSNQIDKIQAVNNFAKIFKQPPQKAVLFFDGKERPLKKNLPMEKANHIRAILKKAGLRVVLKKVESRSPVQVPLEADSQSSAQASHQPVQQAETEKGWDLDQPGTVIVKKQVIDAPDIDTSNLNLDEVGVELAKKKQVPKLEFDLHEMSLDEVGAIFAKKEIVEVPEFDLDDIDLDDVGAVMDEKKYVPKPDFAFDGMDIEEAGSVLPQPEKPKKPEINTDNLKLE